MLKFILFTINLLFLPLLLAFGGDEKCLSISQQIMEVIPIVEQASAPLEKQPLARLAMPPNRGKLMQQIKKIRESKSLDTLTEGKLLDLIEKAYRDGVLTLKQKSEIFNLKSNKAMRDRFVSLVDSNIDELRLFTIHQKRKMMEKSEQLTKKMMINQSKGTFNKVDAILVGGGPQNSILASSIKSADPNFKMLTLEASENSGTFDKLGETFYSNSGEFIQHSSNNFLNAPITVHDIDMEGDKFVKAKVLGDATLFAQDFADANVLYKQKVMKVMKKPNDEVWPAKYRVETESGLIVYSDNVVIGTGLGKSSVKFTDEETLSYIVSESAKSSKDVVSKIESVDVALSRLKENKDAYARYKGEDVIVIGDGDGGKVAIEALKDEAEKFTWIGSDWDDFEKFKLVNPPRYQTTFNAIYRNGKIKANPGKAVKVTPILEGPNKGKVQVSIQGADGVVETIMGDRVIYATGYENVAKDLLKDFTDPKSGEEVGVALVKGRLDDFSNEFEGQLEVPIGSRVIVGGKETGVIINGIANGFRKGKGISPEEFKYVASFIGTIGRRSEAMALDILRTQNKGFKISPKYFSKDSGQTSLQVKTKKLVVRSQSPLVARVEAKLELAKALTGFRMPADSKELAFLLKWKGDHLVLEMENLSLESVRLLANELEENTKLLVALKGAALAGTKDLSDEAMILINIPTKKDGRLKFDAMSLYAE